MLVLIATSVLFILATIVMWRLWRAFTLYAAPKEVLSNKEKPTVSICIPARNEMHALTECLERVLKSDYEKLEILVFDDSSADDTSVLIKSFAHEGVRFVPGTLLPEGWLGKNHAIEVLAREASGNIIVFMSVDTHIKPDAISKLVSIFQAKNAEMISVLPQRRDGLRASVLFGTLRYFWQLLAPGAHYPTTSSAFWMIRREILLNKLGGMRAFSSSVEPEAHIARRLPGSYSAFISESRLGVGFEKKWRSQCETARRLLFPQFGGKWWSLPLGLLALSLLNAPTFIAILSFLYYPSLRVSSAILLAASMLLYGIYLMRMWAHGWWIGMLLWPYIAVQELILFVASCISYASGTVTWKGRNVITAKSATAKEL